MPETVHHQYSELERRRDDITARLGDDDLHTPDNVFDPLLAQLDTLLDEIQYDIETLTDLSGETHDFYEEICNDLADGHTHLKNNEDDLVIEDDIVAAITDEEIRLRGDV